MKGEIGPLRSSSSLNEALIRVHRTSFSHNCALNNNNMIFLYLCPNSSLKIIDERKRKNEVFWREIRVLSLICNFTHWKKRDEMTSFHNFFLDLKNSSWDFFPVGRKLGHGMREERWGVISTITQVEETSFCKSSSSWRCDDTPDILENRLCHYCFQ